MQRHTRQELIGFLNAVEAAVPAGKIIHANADDYVTHKHPKRTILASVLDNSSCRYCSRL